MLPIGNAAVLSRTAAGGPMVPMLVIGTVIRATIYGPMAASSGMAARGAVLSSSVCRVCTRAAPTRASTAVTAPLVLAIADIIVAAVAAANVMAVSMIRPTTATAAIPTMATAAPAAAGIPVAVLYSW